MQLNWFDIVLILIMLWSALTGLRALNGRVRWSYGWREMPVRATDQDWQVYGHCARQDGRRQELASPQWALR